MHNLLDLDEPLITPAVAAGFAPAGRNGRPTHPNTIVRWIVEGVGGVKLEAVRLGGRWLTSKAALSRFAARLTEKARGEAREACPC